MTGRLKPATLQERHEHAHEDDATFEPLRHVKHEGRKFHRRRRVSSRKALAVVANPNKKGIR